MNSRTLSTAPPRRSRWWQSLAILAFGLLLNNTASATTCANATVLAYQNYTSQAVVCGTTNDITSANSTTCGSDNYKGGNEALYRFVSQGNGTATLSYSGQTWTGITVYSGCPTAGGACVNSTTSSGSSKSLTVTLVAGVEYFFMFDTWPSPDSPCAGTFTLTVPPAAAPCTGTPTPGATTGPAGVASGATVNLGLQNLTSGTGVSYQWYVSTISSSGPWTLGGSSPSYSPVQTQLSWYYADVTCDGNTAASTVLEVDIVYCTPAPTSVDGTGITRVVFSTVDNPTGSEPTRYGDYSALVGDVIQNTTVPVAITFTTGYTYGTKIWIDWNDDKDFDDAGEEVYSGESTSANPTTLNASFAVGMAPPGPHRMRIGSADSGTLVPCYTGSYGSYEDYTVNVIASTACSGTPAPGATTGPANACAGVPFTLSIANTITDSGISYQWFADDGSGPVPVGTNAATLTTTQSVATSYYVEVTCSAGPSTGTSTTLSVAQNAPSACYCTPASSNANYYINSFTTTGGTTNISNTSTGYSAGGYGDFTALSVGQVASTSVDFTAELSTFSTFGLKIWVDWNQNGTFEAGEVAFSSGGYSSTHTGTIAVPLTATPGVTRMRMGIAYLTNSGPANACSTSNDGEYEDYSFEVIALTACAGTPAPGATTGPANACDGVPFTLGIANSITESGISYQWYADDGSGPVMVGTNSATYTTSQSVATSYYVEVTCSTGPSTAASTTLSVGQNPPSACYCTPGGTNTSYYINNFSTTGGYQNISNSGTGYSAGGYGDFSAQTVSQSALGTVNFTTNYGGTSTFGFRIWVDWNQNGSFADAGEVAYSSSGYSGTHSGTITVPAGAAFGTTRMRIANSWGTSDGPSSPCSTSNDGEYEDYSFTVTAPPTCEAPMAVSVSGITTTDASVSFSCVTCTGTYIVEYGAPGFTPGTGATAGVGGTVVTGAASPISLSGLNASSTYVVYVREDCGGGDLSANSLSATFATACGTVSIPFAQNFNSVSTPSLPSCWTLEDVNGGSTWATVAQNANGFTGNVARYGYDGSQAANDWLITPGLQLTGGQSYRVSYKYAASSTSYTEAMDVWYGSDATVGSMTNLIVDHGNFSFTAASSVTIDFTPAATGSYHIGWHAKSAADQFNIYVDDIEVDISPTCMAPGGITITDLSPISADLTWNTLPNGVDYIWELRASGLPGSGPTGLIANGSGAAALANATGLSANTNYSFYVRTDCDEPALSDWSTAFPVFTGYCSAGASSVDELISNVTLVGAGINNSSTGSGVGGYQNFTSVVGNVFAGETYPLSVNVTPGYTEDQILVWIDLNNNLLFEPSELLFTSDVPIATTPINGSITIPANQAGGVYRMRIRLHASETGPNATPCGNSSWGQVEDYTISVCGAPSASGSVTAQDCLAETFEVTYAVANIGTGSSATLNYAFNGVAQTPIPYTGSDIVISGINSSTTVSASLDNNEGCGLVLPGLYTNCDIVLDCGEPAILQSHCYETADNRTWTYINNDPTGSVDLKFLSGVMDGNDQFLFWEGAVGVTPATPATLTGALSGTGVGSVGNVLSVSILTDGSGSCEDGAFGGISWQVRCGGCTEPTGYVTIDEGEIGIPLIDCTGQGTGTFNPYVAIFDTGIDQNTGLPPATVGYRVVVNGVPQADVTGLPGGDYYDMGTFALGTQLGVTLLHEDQVDQTACNNTLESNFTVPASYCGPANDLCANATPFTIAPAGSCPANGGVTANTFAATRNGADPSCATGVVDVWYNVNTTNYTNVQFVATAGTATTIGVEVFTACGTPYGVCLTNIAGTLYNYNLPPDDYLVRFFTPAVATGTFEVCFSGMVPPANDNCGGALSLTVNPDFSCGAVTAGTILGASASPEGLGGCFGTANDDVWFSFVATSTAHRIELRNITGAPTDLYHSLWTGGCGSLTLVPGTCSDPNSSNPSGLTIGDTYFLRVYSYSANAGATTSFEVCIGTPPPPGSECNDAIAITGFPVIDQAMVCNGVANPGLLNSGNVPSPCGGASTTYMGGAEGLYTFVPATTSNYEISYNGVSYVGFFVYADACPTNGGTCVGSTSSSGSSSSLTVAMTAGTTYYIWFDSWPSPDSPCPGTFSINLPPAPPANDECAGAVGLTVNPNYSCGSVTAGTVAAATASGNALGACFGNANNDVWYNFVATSTAHRVSLTNLVGSTTDMYMKFYSGTDCGSLVDFACSDPETANLTGLSIGGTYYVRVYSYGSTSVNTTFNICVGTAPPAGSECDDAIAITGFPVVSQAMVCNSAPNPGLLNSGNVPSTCGGASTLYMGGAEGLYTFVPATTSNYEISYNGVSYVGFFVYADACPTNGGTCVGSTSSSGSSSSLTVAMTAGTTYYIWFDSWPSPDSPCPGTFSINFPPAPPANDECAGAVGLTVNADYSCGSVTAGTVAAATASGNALGACFGDANNDVWYNFVATNTAHRVSLTNLVGSTTDMYMKFYSGAACGSLVDFACSDPETANLTGLTIGGTYYVRVYSYGSTSVNTTFNICVGTPPPPPANDNCGGAYALTVNPDFSCGAVTAGTLVSATASPEDPSACTGTENDDVWFSFVATATTHRIDLLNITGSPTDLVHSVWQGACGSLTLVPGTCSDPNSSTPTGLIIGNTYFLRVYSYSSSTGASTNFNVCIGTTPPIPANDNCGGAFSVAVNPDYSCGSVTAGSIASATASPESASACSGTENDDVWFTFVATDVTHRIDLTNVTGSTTDLYHSLWTGGCGTLTLVPGTCSDPNFSNPTGLTIGNTYYLRVYSWGSSAGATTSFDVCIGTTPPVPANDLCANAIPVGCNSSTPGTSFSGTTTGAPTGTCGTTLNTAPGVWYTVEGWGGPITASLCGASYDTKIGVFTGSCGSLVCVDGNDDECGVQSSVTWTSTAGTNYYIYVTAFSTNTGIFDLLVTCGSLGSACTSNGLTIDFQTDANPGQTTWEVRAQGGAVLVTGAGPLVAPNGIQSQDLCLPDGCYTLVVYDAAGDGITNGGYVLRRSGAVAADNRIIDNFRNFNSGSVSSVSGGPNAFCFPMSEQKPLFVARDKMDWVSNEYFVCEPDQAVSDVWLNTTVGDPQRANSGYQFWFYDPNGGFSYRRGRYHSSSDGFGPANEFRACHMKINNWVVANQIPADRMMNVRVRTRVNGVYGEFGPAYRFMIDPVSAACPLTMLNNIPDQQYLSCNSTRNWGGNNYVHARQKSGVNKYQFRFRIAAENFVVVRSSNTYFLKLNWATDPLEPGKTYDVDVRVSKDGGATWCTSGPSWGESCTLTITSQADGDTQDLSLENNSNEGLSMWPNPNTGDQVWIDLKGIEAGVEAVAVDIYDMTGKQLVARMIPTQGDRLNTVLELDGDLATGMYLVNITAGSKRYTERLVIAN